MDRADSDEHVRLLLLYNRNYYVKIIAQAPADVKSYIIVQKNLFFESGIPYWVPLKYPPGACIIKLITAVIYGFRNKLECLSLASISSLF